MNNLLIYFAISLFFVGCGKSNKIVRNNTALKNDQQSGPQNPSSNIEKELSLLTSETPCQPTAQGVPPIRINKEFNIPIDSNVGNHLYQNNIKPGPGPQGTVARGYIGKSNVTNDLIIVRDISQNNIIMSRRITFSFCPDYPLILPDRNLLVQILPTLKTKEAQGCLIGNALGDIMVDVDNYQSGQNQYFPRARFPIIFVGYQTCQ